MKEFQIVFQLTKTIIFEVKYYTLSTNEKPHFTTSAAQFCRNKRDFNWCGQVQNDLIKGFPMAMRFFKKWNALHLHDLTQSQYDEMLRDLEEMKAKYNYIFEELDESCKPYNPGFDFCRLVEWTKQDPKK